MQGKQYWFSGRTVVVRLALPQPAHEVLTVLRAPVSVKTVMGTKNQL